MSVTKWFVLSILTMAYLAPMPEVHCAKILALMTTVSPSHHIWNRSLMRALAARGHQVTVLSPDPEKSPIPNHKDLAITGSYEQSHSVFNFEEYSNLQFKEAVGMLFDFGKAMAAHNMASNATRYLKGLKEKYDLIIVEIVLEECFLGFAPHFGSPPVIAITAWSSPPWASAILSNPDNPSYIPNLMMPLTDQMSFSQRFYNSLGYAYTWWYRTYKHMPEMDRIARSQFGQSLASVSELERNISLILVNTHYSFDHPRPLVPAMIPVGGMHITPSKPLPEDLKKFMDEAKDGVIFFSLGSNLRSDQMDPEKISALLGAFKELPQRVLWKFESDTLPGQPKNVKLGKWLPQNDIFGHPNCRLFITHSGLLSTQEAIYHGIPMVGIPFFADQHINIGKSIAKGVGEKLIYAELTKEKVLQTVRHVLTTPSYRENMKRLSSLFRDQPETPLERAVFWTEYVIRHKGAPHLRSAAGDLTWYQYLLLDVVAALLLALTALLAVTRCTVKALGKLLARKLRKPKQQ